MSYVIIASVLLALAHCSGESAAFKVLLESFPTTPVPLPQICFPGLSLLCGIPRGGLWGGLFGLSRGEWSDFWLITPVLYVLFFNLFSRDFSTLLISYHFLKAFLCIGTKAGFILIFNKWSILLLNSGNTLIKHHSHWFPEYILQY